MSNLVPLLSLVIPCYNEEQNLPLLIDRCREVAPAALREIEYMASLPGIAGAGTDGTGGFVALCNVSAVASSTPGFATITQYCFIRNDRHYNP